MDFLNDFDLDKLKKQPAAKPAFKPVVKARPRAAPAQTPAAPTPDTPAASQAPTQATARAAPPKAPDAAPTPAAAPSATAAPARPAQPAALTTTATPSQAQPAQPTQHAQPAQQAKHAPATTQLHEPEQAAPVQTRTAPAAATNPVSAPSPAIPSYPVAAAPAVPQASAVAAKPAASSGKASSGKASAGKASAVPASPSTAAPSATPTKQSAKSRANTQTTAQTFDLQQAIADQQEQDAAVAAVLQPLTDALQQGMGADVASQITVDTVQALLKDALAPKRRRFNRPSSQPTAQVGQPSSFQQQRAAAAAAAAAFVAAETGPSSLQADATDGQQGQGTSDAYAAPTAEAAAAAAAAVLAGAKAAQATGPQHKPSRGKATAKQKAAAPKKSKRARPGPEAEAEAEEPAPAEPLRRSTRPRRAVVTRSLVESSADDSPASSEDEDDDVKVDSQAPSGDEDEEEEPGARRSKRHKGTDEKQQAGGRQARPTQAQLAARRQAEKQRTQQLEALVAQISELTARQQERLRDLPSLPAADKAQAQLQLRELATQIQQLSTQRLALEPEAIQAAGAGPSVVLDAAAEEKQRRRGGRPSSVPPLGQRARAASNAVAAAGSEGWGGLLQVAAAELEQRYQKEGEKKPRKKARGASTGKAGSSSAAVEHSASEGSASQSASDSEAEEEEEGSDGDKQMVPRVVGAKDLWGKGKDKPKAARKKKGRGRPAGSKDSAPRKPAGLGPRYKQRVLSAMAKSQQVLALLALPEGVQERAALLQAQGAAVGSASPGRLDGDGAGNGLSIVPVQGEVVHMREFLQQRVAQVLQHVTPRDLKLALKPRGNRLPPVPADAVVDINTWSMKAVISRSQAWDRQKQNRERAVAAEQRRLAKEERDALARDTDDELDVDADITLPRIPPSARQTTPEAPEVAGPRLVMGPDGRLVIDAGSLHVQAQQQADVGTYVRVEEGANRAVNAATYMKKASSERWTEDDTALFYRAIRAFGTDFTLVAQLFPTRDRRNLKNKFNREEREYPDEIREALHPKSVDAADKAELLAVIKARLQQAAEQRALEAGPTVEALPAPEGIQGEATEAQADEDAQGGKAGAAQAGKGPAGKAAKGQKAAAGKGKQKDLASHPPPAEEGAAGAAEEEETGAGPQGYAGGDYYDDEEEMYNY